MKRVYKAAAIIAASLFILCSCGEDSFNSPRYYSTPVFPLTAAGIAEDLSAERLTVFDYTDCGTFLCDVTDEYVITNTGKEATTAELRYPVYAALSEEAVYLPTVLADGQLIKTYLKAGPAFSDFSLSATDSVAAGGQKETEDLERLNMYRAAFDAGYEDAAFDAEEMLSENVIVYEFSKISGPAPSEEAQNPTFSVEFDVDPQKSMVFSYRFNGMLNDWEELHFQRLVSVPQQGWPDHGKSSYLIVLGEDIENISLCGWTDGGAEVSLDGIDASMRRYEARWDEVYSALAEDFFESESLTGSGQERDPILERTGPEEFAELAYELIPVNGQASYEEAMRHGETSLDEFFQRASGLGRLVYTVFPVEIPAGSSVTVSLSFSKASSHDFKGKHRDLGGFSLACRLGSDLYYSSQRAELRLTDGIELRDNDLGLEKGQNAAVVTLAPERSCYFFDVSYSDIQ